MESTLFGRMDLVDITVTRIIGGVGLKQSGWLLPVVATFDECWGYLRFLVGTSHYVYTIRAPG
eukprot:4375869-Amphidinium_carterae.1